MSLFDEFDLGDLCPQPGPCRVREASAPLRSASFGEEPGYYEPAALWFYGNAKLLDADLACVEDACGQPDHLPAELDHIEMQAESLVLKGKVLVCGVHSPAHQRAAVVPLRWGSPRIVVVSGGFYYHLGENLESEPFRAARLWRYAWDPKTDLIVSRRAPDKQPTFAQHNPTIDRLVQRLANRELWQPQSIYNPLGIPP